ncbi:MAG: hypothetical protein RBS88_11935 [Spongiibacteraceae bacterium]|jgi:hypothetical protein|nr:hypothetical protein [Spongiibacteraceae bacterium]
MQEEPAKSPAAQSGDAPLNQSLKREHDPNYGPAYQGTDFIESISVKKEGGRVWPMIWLVAFILCVVITIVLLV